MLDIRTTLRSAPFLKGAGLIPFENIADTILGKNYELSLVVCGDDLARRMNKEYRKKKYKPNILSFPLSKKEGEIFLNVHGCFHLKGLRHGRIMEIQEQRILRAFHFSCNGQYTQE